MLYVFSTKDSQPEYVVGGRGEKATTSNLLEISHCTIGKIMTKNLG